MEAMEKFKPNTDERPAMIIFGIVALYCLVTSFAVYLFLLHRISVITLILSVVFFTLIYLPRLLIILKLKNKDKIQITDSSVDINGQSYEFCSIIDFKCDKKSPNIVFVFNNNLIVYQEAHFLLKCRHGFVNFVVIGSEKIRLMNEFFTQLLDK